MRTLALASCLLGTFVDVCHPAEVLATFGSYRRYLDEPAAFSSGVSVKIPVTRRISVRPEFLADSGRVYSNLLALGSVTGDFTDPEKLWSAIGLRVAALCGHERKLSPFMRGNGRSWAAPEFALR